METPFIYSKMASILNDVDAIKKDKTNTQQNYKFRGIDDMYNALHVLFAKYQVFITSNVLKIEREERTSIKGTNLIYTVIQIEFNFITIDGSSVSSIMIGEAMDSGDKSANKAMSTALKYALMQAFLIPTDDLIDSDKDTYEVKGKKKDIQTEIIQEIGHKFNFDKWDKVFLDDKKIKYASKIYQLSDKAYEQLQKWIESQLGYEHEKMLIAQDQQSTIDFLDNMKQEGKV